MVACLTTAPTPCILWIEKDFTWKIDTSFQVKKGNMRMDRETARDSINSRPITDFVTVNYDRNRKPCCPICGSGTGKNHTSALSVKQIGGKYRVFCFADNCFGDKGEDTLGALKIIWNCTESKVIEKCGYGKDSTLPPVKIQPLPKEPPVDYGTYLKECNANIDKAKDYLLSRGISVETAKACYLGYDENWKHPKVQNAPTSPRLIIPTSRYGYTARDTRNNLTEKQEQYQKQKTGTSSMFKYAIRPNLPLFIVEGELDAISIYECGGSALGMGSTNKKDMVIDFLEKIKPGYPVILALDNDFDKEENNGQETQKYIAEKLTEKGIDFVNAEYPQGINDANDLLVRSREEMQDYIAKYEDMATSKAEEETTELQQSIEEESIASYRDYLFQEIDDNQLAPRLSTGFWELDSYMGGGLFKGLYLLGGTSSSGKTTFLVQCADGLAINGNPVLFFSMEQSRLEIVTKSISRLSKGICLDRTGNTNNAQSNFNIMNGNYRNNIYSQEIISLATEQYFNTIAPSLWIYEGRCSTQFIEDKVSNFIKAYGTVPVVMVDYLQLAKYEEPGKSFTDLQEINNKVAHLKHIVDKYKLPMIVISSLNRETYKDNSRNKPTPINLSSFKGSGEIEYTADTVWALNYKAIYDSAEYNENEEKRKPVRNLVLDILKSRNNSTGEQIEFDYEPVFNDFKDKPNSNIPTLKERKTY